MWKLNTSLIFLVGSKANNKEIKYFLFSFFGNRIAFFLSEFYKGQNLIIRHINVEAAQVLIPYIKCVFEFASKHCNINA